MEISTIAGMIGGFLCMVIGILLDGSLKDFLSGASFFITVGGTVAALVMSFPMQQVKAAMKVLPIAFKKTTYDPSGAIAQIIDLANTARKDGLLALENMLDDIDNPFLRKGIMLVVDGSNSELVKNVMETEIYYMQERHSKCIEVFNAGAGYAPAFGMAGTLIGLINMLVRLNDSSTLGSSMAIALVTTFYGVLMANLFFSPLARKLKTFSYYEGTMDEMMLEGILSIQDGENPRIIRDKLESFISREDGKLLDQRLSTPHSGDEQ